MNTFTGQEVADHIEYITPEESDVPDYFIDKFILPNDGWKNKPIKLKDLLKDKDFKDYYKYEERLQRCKSHRILAIRRGEDAGFLKVSIRPDEKRLLERLNKFYIKNGASSYIEAAIKEAYKRLLAPSI